MNRKCFLTTVTAALFMLNFRLRAASPQITVFKDPTCGCCGNWAAHLQSNGFEVTIQEVHATAEYRHKYGVPDSLASCHTAIVDGYTIEGHVPAADIQRLLKERPKAKGLAVPGMPVGSPGMEGARSQPYSVMMFDANGKAVAYHSYSQK